MEKPRIRVKALREPISREEGHVTFGGVTDATSLIQTLQAAGLIPAGFKAEVVQIGKPKTAPEPNHGRGPTGWDEWAQFMSEVAAPGWSPCQIGTRGADGDGNTIRFVYGIARGPLGLHKSGFIVCDEEDPKPGILTSMTHIPTGIGLGLYIDSAVALEAADLVFDPRHLGYANRWDSLPKTQLDYDDKQQALAWRAHMDWFQETLRFNGIIEDGVRHVHTPEWVDIWIKDPAAIAAGKPSRKGMA